MDGQEIVKREDGITLPQDLEALKTWGKLLADSGVLPKEMNAIQAAVVIQTGREIGLQPLQAVRNISMIKGRLCLSTQLQLALARKDGIKIAEVKEETVDFKTNSGSCTIVLERNGEKVSGTFSMKDAGQAGLLRADSGWQKYPAQMLYWRAVGIALRRIAPDLILGFYSTEEAQHFEEPGIPDVLAEVTANPVEKKSVPKPIAAKKIEPETKKAEMKVKETAPVPAPEPPKKKMVNDVDLAVLDKEHKVSVLRAFLKSIIQDKKYKSSPEKLEGALAVKFGGKTFDDVTDENLILLYQTDIFPKLDEVYSGT